MKTKTTLILLAIVVALGVWIKFYESQRPNTEEAKRRAGNVVNIEPGKVEGKKPRMGGEDGRSQVSVVAVFVVDGLQYLAAPGGKCAPRMK